MPLKKQIVYPIFLECCNFTNDGFWKYIFEDLAYGKPPYGCSMNKGFIYCNYKGKEFSYKIEETKDANVIFDDLYNLFTNKLKVLSKLDKQDLLSEFEREENSSEYGRDMTWKSIKKKSIKDMIIQKYVISEKKRRNLSIEQARKLLSLIFINLSFGIISSEDIHYEKGKILYIEGIEFNNNNEVLYHLNVENLNGLNLHPVEYEKKIMSENWPKYLAALKKQAY
jgi:hypothetical protein